MSLKGQDLMILENLIKSSQTKLTLTRFKDDELSKDICEDFKAHKDYVKAHGIVKDSDMFDNKFFKISLL